MTTLLTIMEFLEAAGIDLSETKDVFRCHNRQDNLFPQTRRFAKLDIRERTKGIETNVESNKQRNVILQLV
jgi:hypothetical protein